MRPRPQRVLVVDDVDDVRELWKAWLTFWGFSVEEACNGLEAVQKARQQPPDLVLMDLWMPVMDGLEATERIKAEFARIPVLALTAAPLADESVTPTGCERVLRKPLAGEELLATIRDVLRKSTPES